MKIVDVGSLLIIFCLGVISFLVTNNILFPICVLIVYSLTYFIYIRRKISSYILLTKRVQSCTHFINNFITSIMVKPSFDDAYLTIIKINDKNLKDYVSSIDEYSWNEKTQYLSNYFKLSVYKAFLNVVNLFMEEGGDIKNISSPLLKEIIRIEKGTKDEQNKSIKYLIEFFLLWTITFAMMLFLRFGLNDFYVKMINSPIFLVLMSIFFAFNLISIILMTNAFCTYVIKEYKND